MGFFFSFSAWNHLNLSAWPGDVHTLLRGVGLFVALMIAGLITSARGPLGRFEKRVERHG